ncbi:hypothetical protein FG381_12470 [Sutterella faecalis]|uniref:Uncharacterized protein n=2 Tax=Sutterella TaxID=40544 RepID=A0AAI9SDX8_9BURK|nr:MULTISPECIES: hypothetical protein [Sutterella]KAB7652309.1 hypothetical protein GBM96_02430 [Sutterella seckii]QDA55682.1 hypothetical protein FG381_12470 [Sutterella faecalis]
MFIRNAAALLIAATLSASAGAFGLDTLSSIADTASSLTGNSTGTKSASGATQKLVDDQAKIAAEYIASSSMVIGAQKDLADALNIKTKIEGLENTQKALKAGNLTSDVVEKVTTSSKSLNAEITKSLKSAKNLSADQKSKIGEGLLKYALGVAGTTKMGIDVKKLAGNFQTELGKADALSKAALVAQLAPTASLAKALPGHATNLVKSGNQLLKLATSQGVDTTKAQKTLKEAAGFQF